MKGILIIIGVLIALFLSAAYVFVWDDEPHFGNAESLKFAYEILGDPKSGRSCPRSMYANEVENRNKSDKSGAAAIFIFRPIAGKEAQCPPIEILVDRISGEPTIIPIDKNGKPCPHDCDVVGK